MNFVEWLADKKCPACGFKRLLAGPFYNRYRIRCQQCNYVFKIKEPKLG